MQDFAIHVLPWQGFSGKSAASRQLRKLLPPALILRHFFSSRECKGAPVKHWFATVPGF
jgi:hypothetical protein